MSRTILLALPMVPVVVAASVPFAVADTIYVPGDRPTIQEGIDAAEDGDEVVVADGTYTGPLNKNLNYGGKLIRVRSEHGPDNCIIDCEGDGRGFYFHSGETAQAVVQGLRIRNGYHPGGGGGVYCINSNPTLTNCEITDNTAGGTYGPGGGVYCYNSNPTLTGCEITGNTSSGSYYGIGGGVYCKYFSSPTLTDCAIVGNTARHGGGVYCEDNCSPTLTNCTITGNTAYDAGTFHGGGGGVYCYLYSSPTLTNCTITGNTAGYGGGVECQANSDPTLTHCTIIGNTAHIGLGGGVYCYESSPTLTNCTIANNLTNFGGGVCCHRYSSAVLTNCTITDNTANHYGGGVFCYSYSTPALTNCILWNNSPEEIRVDGGEPIVTYCDVEGGWDGQHNTDADPLFVDPNNGDYRLSSDSPCIDAGDNDGLPADTLDLDGDGDTSEPLPIDLDFRLRCADRVNTPDTGNPGVPGPPIVDLGAYEYQCSGDLDGDGDIDLSDLAQLLANYGITSGACYADGDIDLDGGVDLSDLAGLLAVYGTTCP